MLGFPSTNYSSPFIYIQRQQCTFCYSASRESANQLFVVAVLSWVEQLLRASLPIQFVPLSSNWWSDQQRPGHDSPAQLSLITSTWKVNEKGEREHYNVTHRCNWSAALQASLSRSQAFHHLVKLLVSCCHLLINPFMHYSEPFSMNEWMKCSISDLFSTVQVGRHLQVHR